MEHTGVNTVLVVMILTATLPGSTMVHAEDSSAPDEDTTNMTRVDNQCSPLQRRQDLLDTRLNGRETRLNGLDTRLNELHSQFNGLSTQLNGLDTRLSTQLNARQNEVNTQLTRMDNRLDGIETAISDMKDFLQERIEAMDKKVERALTDIRPRQDVSTARPDTTPKQDVSTARPDTMPQQDVSTARPDTTPKQDVSTARPDTTPKQADTVTEKTQVYRDCKDALTHGVTTSGVYNITPDQGNSINVYCEQRLDGGGWTVFQARKDGSVNFYRDWNAYKAGFGVLMGEFWLGNTNINLLTKHNEQQLKIELTSPEGEVQYADYSHFSIGDESQKYMLSVSGFSGRRPLADSLTYSSGSQFSTKDADNDVWPSVFCAKKHMGAWWYKGCSYCCLNGVYGSTESSKGLYWYHWKGYSVSMKATRMMVRRRV